MRILLVNKFFYRKGGSETYLFALADGLRAMGHAVAFFSMQHPNNKSSYWSKYFVSEKEYNGEGSAFQKVKAAATIAYSPEAKRKFEALCEEFCPDIIHLNLVHRQITFSILDAPYVKKHRVPVVYTSHEYSLVCPAYTMLDGNGEICEACVGGHYLNVLKRTCTKGSKAKSALSFMEAEFLKWSKAYDKIDLIIACSKFMKQKLDEGGYSDRTIAMQNFLTDGQRAMGQKVADTHKYEEEAASQHPYFLYFGRLSKEKGILTLVKAFLQAAGLSSPASETTPSVSSRAEHSRVERPYLPSNWDLHIVGEGPERQVIESMIKSAGPEAQSRIKLFGYKTGEELQQEVGNARYSVLSSEWYENMPYSGLESLAAQTPIIGANIGGIPEIVLNGRTGFLFESGNIRNLADKLIQASTADSDDYEHMQDECAEYVGVRCDQRRYIEHLLGEYHELRRQSSGDAGSGMEEE